jgi:hypothetical protein
MAGISRVIGAGLLTCLFTGCAVVPQHDGLARVQVDEVVKRVKCDIARAVLLKTNQQSADGKFPFAFLSGWAAKLHFTIVVDDTASLNPGATLIHPLPSVGSTSQSYSTGLGVGLQSEAVRQEDYEYLMSFSDMAKEFNKPESAELYQGCNFENGLLLESDLGLTELVDSALKPIESRVLHPGNNIGPGAAPPTTPAKQLSDPVGQLAAIAAKHAPNKRNEFTFDFRGESEAAEIEKRTQAVINNIVKPLYGIATTSSFDPKCLQNVTQSQNEAIVWSVGVSENVIRYDQATAEKDKTDALETVKKDFIGAIKAANNLIATYKTCANQDQKDKPKVFDPIDAIGETVNFYVTASGSVTPTWKLVKVTAPLASTFASASRKDTNTLILSMGRPVVAADGSISASQAMTNQILSSLLSQAIAQRPVP